MVSSKLIVRPHHPRWLIVRAILVVVALVVLGWGVYETGRAIAGHDFVAAREERRQLLNDLQRNERENADLRARLAIVERSSQVDSVAHGDLRTMLADLNAEILTLREELEFYRGIVSPADTRRGLRVHDLRLEPMDGTQAWRFRLVLIQAMQHDRQAQGTARLTIVGTGVGSPQRIALSELGDVPEDGIAFDFRYFQEFDGDILLPEGFVPNRVEVELVPRSSRDGRVEQVFDWPVDQ